jgi:uncharacterized protein YggE
MKKTKRIAMIFGALVLSTVLVTALTLRAAAPVNAQAQTIAAQAPTITVSGAGAITMSPDMATINLGVTTEAPTAAEALRINSADVEAVIAAVRAFGIDEEDIRTQWFSIHPRMDWGRDWSGPGVVVGYTVSNTVTVIVRDLDIVGEVLGAGVTAGANNSGGIQFSVSDSSEQYLEALALAARDARRKADTLARALGSEVTAIVNVTEQSSFHAPVVWADSFDQPMMEVVEAAYGMRAPQVPVAPGELTVTARVQVVFAMR